MTLVITSLWFIPYYSLHSSWMSYNSCESLPSDYMIKNYNTYTEDGCTKKQIEPTILFHHFLTWLFPIEMQ